MRIISLTKTNEDAPQLIFAIVIYKMTLFIVPFTTILITIYFHITSMYTYFSYCSQDLSRVVVSDLFYVENG